MNKRRILFSAAAILLLIAIAACMMVIGRGHTMYFDNKKLEYEGQTYDTYRRINVFVGGEQVAKLSAKDRGMATFMGQKLSFDIEVTKEKGDEPDENQPAINEAEFIVTKNRHGPTKTVTVAWNGDYTMFSNLEVLRNDL